jgi:recombination protein RecA
MSREDRIAGICKNINDSKFGGENNDAVTWLGSRDVISLERFPSGCPALDDALGGGWPKGRHIELYGPESGGKSTTSLHAIVEHQKKYPDEDVAYIDTEYAFDEEYAENLGVHREWLIVCQPEDGVQALNVAYNLIMQGVGLVVFDSVAALVTKAEIDGEIGDTMVATQARLMSQSLRKINAAMGQRGATIMWTNQLRDKIGVTWGDQTTTSAGRALRHYASVRAMIVRIGAGEKEKINGVDIVVSNKVRVDVKKNKTAPPYRRAEFYITFGLGIDRTAAVLDAALAKKVIAKKGSWFSFGGENIAQGRAAVLNLMRDTPELMADIEANIAAGVETEAGPDLDPVEESIVRPTRKTPKARSGDEVKVDDV